MDLQSWLDHEDIPDSEFAERLGVDRTAVFRYRTGGRFPKLAILARIALETDGAVMPNDFLPFEIHQLLRKGNRTTKTIDIQANTVG